jgi:hypothetical protein
MSNEKLLETIQNPRRNGFDQLADSMAVCMKAGTSVMVGMDELPFWLKRELVKSIRATNYIPTCWTLDEPTTSEWEARTEAYFKDRFPQAREIALMPSRKEAEELTALFLDLADDLEGSAKKEPL